MRMCDDQATIRLDARIYLVLSFGPDPRLPQNSCLDCFLFLLFLIVNVGWTSLILFALYFLCLGCCKLKIEMLLP